MEKVLTIGLGKSVFNIEENAYRKLKSYIDRFEVSIVEKDDLREIMQDVEARIAELFYEEVKSKSQVVNVALVEKVAAIMGIPEEDEARKAEGQPFTAPPPPLQPERGYRRFYRNPDDLWIGGVCSGIAAYFRIDPLAVRAIFGCMLIFIGTGLLVYLILWLVVPKATTIREKLEMQGIPATAENIRNYSSK